MRVATKQAARQTTFTYNELHLQTSRTLPGCQSEYKSYDAHGRLIKTTDFEEQITKFMYDDLGRLQFKKYYVDQDAYDLDTATTVVEMVYDNLSRVDKVKVDGIDEQDFAYDAESRVISITTLQGVIAYEYSPITGRKLFTRTPADGSDTEIEYTYDVLGRLASVIVHKRNGQTVNEVTSYTYDEVGSLKSITYPNGNYTYYEYDALNRLIKQTNFAQYEADPANPTGAIRSSYTYTLADDGQRASVTESDGTTTNWTYDNLNKLLTENYNAPGSADDYSHSYVYDLVGNRKTKTVNGTAVTNYFYTIRDQLDYTTGAEIADYGYDLNGSLTQRVQGGQTTTYAYNVQNRLESVTEGGITTSYRYNTDDVLVQKQTIGGSLTNYLIDPYNHTDYPRVLKETTGSVQTCYVIGSDIIAQAIGAGHSSIPAL